MPPKFTNDSAEFSFRQLAIARTKFGGEREHRHASCDVRKSASKVVESPPKRHSVFQNQVERRAGGPPLDQGNEERLQQTQQQILSNPKDRKYQPTYTGFLADQMSPKKNAVDNKPTVVNAVTRVPGQYGWGIERNHLRAEHNIITDDTRVPSYPIQKMTLAQLDQHRTAMFTRFEGDRAAQLDKKLGVDYHMYNALNMQA